MNKVCVVIPMYGKEEYTQKCIDLTIKNAGMEVNILVVDDGSEEPFLAPYNSQFDTIRIDKNSGFTNAVNQGILYAQELGFKYVHLLNNDTEPEPDFIKTCFECCESDESVGISCSVRIHPNRKPHSIELCGVDLIRGYQCFTDDANLPSEPLECNWIPLCSALMRVQMIREIGLLDKRFRNHCSDSSYCIHAKMNGWKVMLVPKSRVIHHLSVTTTNQKVDVEKDQRLFLEKLAGLDYAKLMKEMPLDCENKTYGKLDFTIYSKA